MHERRSTQGLNEAAALGMIFEGTATATGAHFFSVLVESLARALGTYGAWVTEYLPEPRRLRALAFWLGGEWVHGYEHLIDGTPCQAVVEGARLVHYPEKVLELFPHEADLRAMGAASYMGVPLLDTDGRVLGHLAVIDRRPMPEDPRALSVFRIFAARASAELQRIRAEGELREREEKLARLVDSAMDAILELDPDLRISRVNPAAEKVFRCPTGSLAGRPVSDLLTPESYRRLRQLVERLDSDPAGERAVWIPGSFTARCGEGTEFPAEATLSRFELRGRTFHTLILRNVNDRVEAEYRIRALTSEAEYLREELKALHNFDRIIGQSEALLRTLREVDQVAETDATVLLLGETGTGKELVARAVHAASRRHDRPFIKVNCAAIPTTLIESEFFGHEKGAFTGATARREGRFRLADGGTIFLDEIGELPLDVQAKLLRVLQEGEFEAVGSSRTQKVDVRVLAATNRDLERAAAEGEFRPDLYYRLNVFPMRVPPLRERGDDVVLLAAAFARRCAQRMGRTIEPLSDAAARRLKAYGWPGNVRELENVIERAVITARDGRLDLSGLLPEPAAAEAAASRQESVGARPDAVLTQQDLEALERQNLRRALEASGWRVAGERGAARLLGMNPSTLSSRMKALGIRRPQTA